MKLVRRLDRRMVLRGVGTTMALPLLEAMLPACAGHREPMPSSPVRMAFLFVPNGVVVPAWEPKETGSAYTLSPTLAPLKEFQSEILVLSGLAQDNGRAKGDGPGDHAREGASFLTGTHPYKTSGANISNGISVDQLAAVRIGGQTQLPSLELGVEPGGNAGSCDSGYSCAYSSNISWRSPTMPMAKEINPKLVFERMFRAAGIDRSERMRRRAMLKGV